MTFIALTTEATHHYCVESLSPAFAHIWVTIIQAVSVTCAMFCLIQFFVQVRADIASHKPLLKVLAIKLVIFLSFWQTMILSWLSAGGAIKATPRFAHADVKVGIPVMLLCIEMVVFSVFHFWSFSYREYVIPKGMSAEAALEGEPWRYQGGFWGLGALLDAMNPWDFWKAFGRGVRWMVQGRARRFGDQSYDVHLGRKKTAESAGYGSGSGGASMEYVVQDKGANASVVQS
jgi:hypothetical protein